MEFERFWKAIKTNLEKLWHLAVEESNSETQGLNVQENPYYKSYNDEICNSRRTTQEPFKK